MKLVIVSDTHNYLEDVEIPTGDVFIHCGDALSSGHGWEFTKFAKLLGSLARRFEYILYTPGNHDKIVQTDPEWCKNVLSENADNIKLLLHESFTVEYTGEKLKFFGSPWTPEFFYWSFMYSHDEAKEVWADAPPDADVMFTHGMPYGILDSVSRLVGKETDCHVGCRELLTKIFQVRPKLYAGGHLHLEGGKSMHINDTLFVNAATCDDNYSPTRQPIVVDTETWEIVK